MNPILDRQFLGNDLLRWGAALVVVMLGAALLRLLQGAVSHRVRAFSLLTRTRVDDVVADLLGRTRLLFLVALSTVAAMAILVLPGRIETGVRMAALLVALWQIGMWASAAARHAVDLRFSAASEDPASRTGAGVLTFGAVVLVWVIVVLVALDNLGIDITALVAGLGVGGIAVALATQNILGDLFASVSILLDKPFVVGDFIVAGGEHMGTVEKIGIKTTRVRSLGGEQLVFANNDLLQSRIRNYKRMEQRRVLFKLGLTYQTPPEKLEKATGLIRTLIEATPETRFDRCHFATYGDSALVLETVYFVLSSDYNRFMDIQERINLAIHRRFAEENLEFAYPTQTLFFQTAAPRA